MQFFFVIDNGKKSDFPQAKFPILSLIDRPPYRDMGICFFFMDEQAGKPDQQSDLILSLIHI